MSPYHRRIDEEFLEAFVLATVDPLPQSFPEGARFPAAEALGNGIQSPNASGRSRHGVPVRAW